jgi:hypothetical protein
VESQSYNKEINQFEQNFWYFNQYSRVLQEYRDEIALCWNDSASQEINGRYLNPHREDSEKIQNNLKDQFAKLTEMNKHLSLISSDLDKTHKLSQEIEMLTKHCKEDIKKSLTTLEVSKEKKSFSRKLIRICLKLLSLVLNMFSQPEKIISDLLEL